MNIIGKGEGNVWELKQALPKFIVGILIVPFSWFLVQFILSVSSILTVWVLTLPYDAFGEQKLFKNVLDDETEKYCTDIVISLSAEASKIEWSTALWGSTGEELGEIIRCEKDGAQKTLKEILSGQDANGDGVNNSIYGIISVYTYGILSLDQLDTITGADLSTIKGLADLVLTILFDILFVVIYLLLMIALFLALLVRGIRLWIFMMLSPVFWLLYFFGKTKDAAGEWLDKFTPKEFISLALVPVYVSAALAFGLVFILVASEWIKEQSQTDNLNKIDAGGFSLSIYGSHADTNSEWGKESGEKSPLAKIIVQLFGVVILWIAVMAALRSSETTKAVVEPIHSFGKQVGELATKSPTYLPIIPAGKWQKPMSVASLPSIGSAIEASPRNAAQERWSAFADSLIWSPGDIQKLNRTMKSLESIEIDNGKWLQKGLSEIWAWLFEPGTKRDKKIEIINNRLGTKIDLKGKSDPIEIANFINEGTKDQFTKGKYSTTFKSWNVNLYIEELSKDAKVKPESWGTKDSSNTTSQSHATESANLNKGWRDTTTKPKTDKPNKPDTDTSNNGGEDSKK